MAQKTAGDTIYMTVADKDGNMVSFIQSIYGIFGSGLVCARHGIHHAESRGSVHPGRRTSQSTCAPHKRPLHTLIPGFL